MKTKLFRQSKKTEARNSGLLCLFFHHAVDDAAAIAAAHAYANEHRLPVRADAGDTYYIASHAASAVIRTDTDWTG
ncbi:MAG: hypothetical protein J6C51_09255, partial [Clostridia bacterium]|nr:hypothetical protein [Clostridia bacterium]